MSRVCIERSSRRNGVGNVLDLLPKAFVFLNERPEGDFVRIDFEPNPDYVPQTMEERVLHGMIGSMLVDPQRRRLHLLEGRLPQDMTLGFGLLARFMQEAVSP